MYDPTIHHRQSLRWRKHNYSSTGSYFVTICTHDHRCLLGNVAAGLMNLNDTGRMVEVEWLEIPVRFPSIRLDEYIVMPNHFHGIIEIAHPAAPAAGDRAPAAGAPLAGALVPATPGPWAGPRPAPTDQLDRSGPRAGPRPAPTLGDVVGAFKSLTTRYYRSSADEFQSRFWQRNYYDHVIRDSDELEKIRDYIRKNPMMWTVDRYNPENGIMVMNESGELRPWNEM